MADELLFLTDAWPPQINGVAITSKLHVDHLDAMGVTTKVVRPTCSAAFLVRATARSGFR